MPTLNLRICLLGGAITFAIICLPGSTMLDTSPAILLVLDKPAAQLTTADLQRFVELASSNQISARQGQAFIAKLSPTQEQTLRKLSEAKIQADLQAGNRSQD